MGAKAGPGQADALSRTAGTASAGRPRRVSAMGGSRAKLAVRVMEMTFVAPGAAVACQVVGRVAAWFMLFTD